MTQDEKFMIDVHIHTIIKYTFEALKDAYDHQKEGHDNKPDKPLSRIVFPKYSDGETRLSEQELRFIFAETFNKYCACYHLDWYYSVETPTVYKYKFSDKGNKIEPIRDDKNGQSAMVDLAIHDAEFNRIALIEFKALNPDKLCFLKDFVKLENEPDVLTYFLMYVKSYDKGTIESLKSKVDTRDSNIVFYCYDLTTGKIILE